MSKSTASSSTAVKPVASNTVINMKDKDHELFEFLNSTESSSSETKKYGNGGGRPRTLLGSAQHYRQSSAGSSAGSTGRKTPPDAGFVEHNRSSPGTPGKYAKLFYYSMLN